MVQILIGYKKRGYMNLMFNGQNQTTLIDTDHQKISSIGSVRLNVMQIGLTVFSL